MDERSLLSASDAALVRSAKAGAAGAFDRLVERYLGSVYAVAYARLRHRESSEDLAQEVFLRAYLNLDALRDGDLFGLWVCRLARNLSVDWLRRGVRASRLIQLVPMEDEVVNEYPDTTGQDHADQLASREAEAGMHADLEQLAEEQREVLLLHYFEGLSKSEIARRLGVHPSSVGRQLDRALQTMREAALSRESGPPEFPRLGMGRKARTCAMIGVAATMSVPEKCALASQAAAWADPVAHGILAPATSNVFSGSVPTTAFTTLLGEGAVLMAKSKVTLATVAAVAILGGGYVVMKPDGPSAAPDLAAAIGTIVDPRGGSSVPIRHELVLDKEMMFFIPFNKSIEVTCKDTSVIFGKFVAGAWPDGTVWQREINVNAHNSTYVNQTKITDPPSPDKPYGGDKAFGFIMPGKPEEPISGYFAMWYRGQPDGIEVHIMTRRSKELVADLRVLADKYLKGQVSQAQFRSGVSESLQRLGLLPEASEFRGQVLAAVQLLPVSSVANQLAQMLK